MWVLVMVIMLNGNPEEIRTAPAHATYEDCREWGLRILKRWSESSDPHVGATFKCEVLGSVPEDSSGGGHG
jgi:hypothetical protein